MIKKIFLYVKVQKLLIRNIFAKPSDRIHLQKRTFVKLNSLVFDSKIPTYFLPVIFKFFKGFTPKVANIEAFALELFRDASKFHSLTSNSNIFKKFVLNSQVANERYWDFALFCIENAESSFSKDLQDLWVLFESTGWENLKFLEIGAGDGVWKSNCKLLHDVGWEGISIEPNPVLAQRFEKNRSNQLYTVALVPNDSLAASKEDPHVTLHYLPGSETQGTLFLNHPESEELIDVIVEASSITKLCAKGFIPHDLTYVSIDMEGGELQILMELLQNGIHPKLITIEHNHVPQIKASITEYMGGNGYQEMFPGIGRNEYFYKLDSL